MLHVLPAGIKRIRHYGLLAAACKTTRLAQARQTLGMPVVEAKTTESAADFMRRVAGLQVLCCPRCKVGQLLGLAVAPALGDLPILAANDVLFLNLDPH